MLSNSVVSWLVFCIEIKAPNWKMSKISQNAITEKYIYRIPRILLNLFGIWPLNTARNTFCFYTLSTVLITAVTASIAHGFMNITHLHVALLSFCPALFELVTWIKLMLFWYHLKRIAKLLNTSLDQCNQGKFILNLKKGHVLSVRHFHITDYNYDQQSKHIYEKCFTSAFRLCFGLFSSSILTGLMFGMTPFIRNLFRYLSGQPIVRELSFQA